MRQRRSRIFRTALPYEITNNFPDDTSFVYTAETEDEARALAEKHPNSMIIIVESVDVSA